MKLKNVFVVWALAQVTACTLHLARACVLGTRRAAEAKELEEAVAVMEGEGGIVPS
jgi:hypothetical protein